MGSKFPTLCSIFRGICYLIIHMYNDKIWTSTFTFTISNMKVPFSFFDVYMKVLALKGEKEKIMQGIQESTNFSLDWTLSCITTCGPSGVDCSTLGSILQVSEFVHTQFLFFSHCFGIISKSEWICVEFCASQLHIWMFL